MTRAHTGTGRRRGGKRCATLRPAIASLTEAEGVGA